MPLLLIAIVSIIFISTNLISGIDIATQLTTLLVSVLSDYLALVVMRRLFASSSQVISIWRIIWTMIALLAFSVSITMLPFLVSSFQLARKPSLIAEDAQLFAAELFIFNVSTALLCLIPAGMLAAILLHRLIWPILSRILYPIASRRVISNRKALLSLGSLLCIYTLNLTPVGIKELLEFWRN